MPRESLRVLLLSLFFVGLTFQLHGQVSFFQPPTYSSPNSSLGINFSFVADFNSDGKLDLLTATGVLNLGNGDGTFRLGTAVPWGVLAVADFNGDGKPDILEQGTDTLLVLLGNGDGTFQAPISTASNANLTVAGAVDLNGDGKADVVGIFNGALIVYLSKGDGTFAAGVSYSLGSNYTSGVLSFGDFNGDGKVDVAVGVGEEIVFLGNGDGTLQTPPKISTTPNFGYPPVVGDFNGDGKLDLVVADGANVSLLKGKGDGTFEAPIALFPENGEAVLAGADLNGDGRLDLVMEQDPTVAQIYLQNPDGTFTNTHNYVLNMSSVYFGSASFTGIAIADFNLDGKGDIAAGQAILLGNADGSFQGIQLGIVPGTFPPTAAVVGKFETNGGIDVAALSGTNLYILHNDGHGKLSTLHTYPLVVSGSSIVTTDLNGDGNLDLAVLGSDPTSGDWIILVFLGNGDGSFQAPVSYPQTVGPDEKPMLVVADFNNDHKPDLAMQTTNQTVAIWLNQGGTLAAPVYYFDAGSDFTPLFVADFNHDGKLDIAVPVDNGTTTATGILYGNGDGTFQPMVLPASLNNFEPNFEADLTNSGNADLIGNGVALGNGDGTFTLLPALPNTVFGIADFNGDGKLDTAVGTTVNSHPSATGVQLGNGDGTFGPFIQVPPAGYVQPSLFADMNGDGRTDIVFFWDAANGIQYKVNGIAILINTTSPGFQLSATPLSSLVNAGASVQSTITASPAFGFNSPVNLTCTGLPSGSSCAFTPASLASGSGTSSVTITTSASTPGGTYTFHVVGTAGTLTQSAALSLQIQAAPDFTFAPSSGTSSSQTVKPGQNVSFSLALTSMGSFTGMVNFSCAITPVVTPAPSCNLSSGSMQLGTSAESLTVTVGTIAAATIRPPSLNGLPPAGFPLAGTFLALCLTGLCMRKRRLPQVLGTAMMGLALVTCISCGGSSSSTHSTSGTPAGTYTATITANSGTLSHNVGLQVVVQ